MNSTDPTGLVKIKQGYQKIGTPFGGGGEYNLAFAKVFTSGKCVSCGANTWKIELSLYYMHGYTCWTKGSCNIELWHANIASAYVAKAAQEFKQYENEIYTEKYLCEAAAVSFAAALKAYMETPNGWPPSIKQGYMSDQWTYENTHHGLFCGLFSSLCGAYKIH